MARMQQWEERERWQEPEEERWPEARGEQRWPQRADDRDGGDDLLPIVNPYAVVALVAALLLLFPVALVFGLISFGYPRGRAIATFALLLGAAEATAVVAFFVLDPGSLTDNFSRAETSVAAQTVAPTPIPTIATIPPTTAAPTVSASPTTAAATTLLTARKGASCTEAQLGAIGQGSDGGTLLCLGINGASGGYLWSGPYNVGTGEYESGAKCDPTISKSGRTADGRALVCEGSGRTGAWVRWTTE
ncbi:hypothetical protein [Nocardia bovistercoris]|uniref:DUF4190 domain-containing protein n=1 Tax=Nocardia bovistercoris TaxID=2785916 RepID=A0A931I789_9NOCA|nr:hypothetical protein [Nocardia bovistercoris]MBH0776232.1 hypothetical protein [Nocardia bovistercoris]